MKKIPVTIATANAHKAEEIARILPPQYEVHLLSEHGKLPEPVENGRTFAANAACKACGYSALIDGLVIADDSGLCVDVLNGQPGVISARYAGTHGDDQGNNNKLLRELSVMLGQQPFTARYMCSISLAKEGEQLANFTGKVEGTITITPRGTNGFGYDPLFIPAGYDCTMAELPPAAKDGISHRAEALKQLAAFLEAHPDL